jgi:energy-coupling factor transport system ATP-binding protein
MGIQFHEVSYSYTSFKNVFHALKKINLSIKAKGEIIGICGQTGSGKSTLVQHMNGLLIAQKGKTAIFDVELPSKKKVKLNSIRQRVGLVFQFPEYQLFEETIIKDIMFGPLNIHVSNDEALKRAENAAKSVGIDPSLWNQSPFRVSGGQMRRVAIAGILAMQPDILVLDEPTRGLDPVGQKELMDLIYKIHIQENKTIIIISHDMELISTYTQRVIVMKEGSIVFDGVKESLFVHEKFNEFLLDYPVTIKLSQFLTKKLNKQFHSSDDMQLFINQLEEASHE